MFFSRNTEARMPEKLAKAEVSNFKEVFQPVVLHPHYEQIQRSVNSFNLTQLYGNFSKQLCPEREHKEISRDVESWSQAQIERLFKLYDYYGPQWKIMSQQMPTRSANNLKNRFYTVLRNLIKLLFRKKADICPKLSGEIPSKDLSRLYDGKQDYKQFKFLVASILHEIEYNLQSPNIDYVVKTYSTEIIKVYKTIYGERAQFPGEKSTKESQYEVMNQEYNINFPLTLCDHQNKLPNMNNVPQPEEKANNESAKIESSQKNEFNYVLFFYYNPAAIFPQQSL